jgi:hypothetical protein
MATGAFVTFILLRVPLFPFTFIEGAASPTANTPLFFRTPKFNPGCESADDMKGRIVIQIKEKAA